MIVEAMCFSTGCGTYDWGTEEEPPTDICPTCFGQRVVLSKGKVVSGTLRSAGGRRGKDTKIRKAYARDAS